MNAPHIDSIIKRAKLNGDQRVWGLIAPNFQAIEQAITTPAPEYIEDFITNIKASLAQTIADTFTEVVKHKFRSKEKKYPALAQRLERIYLDKDLLAWSDFLQKLKKVKSTKSIKKMVTLATYLDQLSRKTFDEINKDITFILKPSKSSSSKKKQTPPIKLLSKKNSLAKLQKTIKKQIAYDLLKDSTNLNKEFLKLPKPNPSKNTKVSHQRRSIDLNKISPFKKILKSLIQNAKSAKPQNQEDRYLLATIRPQIRIFEEILKAASRTNHQNRWREFAGETLREISPKIQVTPHPNESLRARDLFTYALLLLEDDVVRDPNNLPKKGRRQNRSKGRGQTENLRRLHSVLKVAQKMQAPNGNFRWAWRDVRPRDLNAADFCMRGAALICQLHKDRLQKEAPATWKIFKRIVQKSMNICWRTIPEKYSNICLLNAMNLILIGESLNWPKAAKEGYKRLDRFCIYTYEWGIHEYVSTTYTAIQIMSLGLIQQYCKNSETKKQAKCLLEFYMLYGLQNWVRGTRRFSGTRSRKLSDYLKTDGNLYDVLWVYGWPGVRKSSKMPMNLIYPALAALSDNKKERVRQDYKYIEKAINSYKKKLDLNTWRPKGPRLIRQSWGANKNQSRTHFYENDIVLSTSHALYDYPDNQDMPLTIDIGNPPVTKKSPMDRLPRTILKDNPGLCYFLPDTENDPYGKNATHHAPLHWAAAQYDRDALGMVLYQPKFFRRLESHLVFPIDKQTEFYLNGHKIKCKLDKPFAITIQKSKNNTLTLTKANGKKITPPKSNKNGDVVLVMRRGEVAVGVKLLWAKTIKGEHTKILFCYDHQQTPGPIRAARLTIQHHGVSQETRHHRYTNAGAIFAVRMTSKVNKANKAKAWINKFTKEALPEAIKLEKQVLTLNGKSVRGIRHISAETLRVKKKKTLKIKTFSPDQRRFFSTISPTPSQAVLDIFLKKTWRRENDEGRHFLNDLKTIKNYNKNLKVEQIIPVSQQKLNTFTYWPSTTARIQAPMEVSSEKYPTGETFVEIPTGKRRGSDIGNATYCLNLEKKGKYYIWARVQTPKKSHTPFRIRIFQKKQHTTSKKKRNSNFKNIELALLNLKSTPTWKWVPLDLNEIEAATYPTPLDLPRGKAYLQIFGNQSGAKIQRFFITTDPNKIPTDKEANTFKKG